MSKKFEFLSKIEDGRLMPAIQAQIYMVARQHEGKIVKITIEEKKKIRSLNQNAFYWSVVIPSVMQMFIDEGNVVDTDEVHEYLKAHVGKLTKEIFTPDGEKKRTLCSTTRLSTIEFEDYLTKIRAWAAEFGLLFLCLMNIYKPKKGNLNG